MSRESLIAAYIAALPFAPVAVVAIPGGGCRVETAAPAPGETIAHLYYFRPSHIELVLGAAGLADGPISQSPDAVAALIERTAVAMGAPFETAAELRAAAEIQVAKVQARVDATNQAGGLKEINKQYRAYRLAQVAKAEKAMQYGKFLEQRYTVSIVRSVAMTGRMI